MKIVSGKSNMIGKSIRFVVRSSKYDGLTFSYMVINLFYIISASVKN